MHTLPTMLVVEDDPFMRKLIREVAKDSGYPCLECATGEDGWQLFEVHQPRVILLDWGLPGMDGLALCRLIKQSPKGSSCIVVMLTARRKTDDLSAVLEAGADDYLAKPFDHHQLRVRLSVAWSRARLVSAQHDAELATHRAHEALARSHADLLSILDLVDVGSAIVDGEGKIVFLSRSMLKIVGEGDWRGKLIAEAFPMAHVSGRDISALIDHPQATRTRVPMRLRAARGLDYLMEVDVRKDPRDDQRRILFFYDVTQVHTLKEHVAASATVDEMVGTCPAMQALRKQIEDVARYDVTVLIEGETGAGKELVARAVHAGSARSNGPFVAINCGGLTESLLGSQLFGHRRGAFTGALNDHVGVFESAHGGTLFLDEIGDIPFNVQTSLLRVLQEREITRIGDTQPRKIDVRLISATHRDLNRAIDDGQLRADFLYRIREGRIRVPPLRQRLEDLPLLASAFLLRARSKFGKPVEAFSSEAMYAMMNYSWPGNVRELGSAVAYGFLRCQRSTIDVHDLPPEILADNTPRPIPTGVTSITPDPPRELTSIPLAERERILDALRRAENSRTDAAKLLGISRATLYRKLEKLGLDSPETSSEVSRRSNPRDTL